MHLKCLNTQEKFCPVSIDKLITTLHTTHKLITPCIMSLHWHIILYLIFLMHVWKFWKKFHESENNLETCFTEFMLNMLPFYSIYRYYIDSWSYAIVDVYLTRTFPHNFFLIKNSISNAILQIYIDIKIGVTMILRCCIYFAWIPIATSFTVWFSK